MGTTLRAKLAALAAALLLASCGGSGPDRFATLVSFGDSLSDVGSYRTAGIAAIGGGRYTVNGPGPLIWVEQLAEQLGLPAPCAAQTGLNASGAFAAFAEAVANHPGCTAYGQGGARVSHPIGPWNAALLGSPDPDTAFTGQLGQLTLPVASQITNHLAASGGHFSSRALVLVQAGNNDLFMLATAIPTRVAELVGGGTDLATASAQAASEAVSAMAVAGGELAVLVQLQLLGRGAQRVVVANMPNISLTPSAVVAEASSPGTQILTDAMTRAFNLALAQGLKDKAGVLLVDLYQHSSDQAARPAAYGLSDVSTPACSTSSPLNPLQGYSLTCTTASVITGDVSRYLFADSVHPTPYAHQLFALKVSQAMTQAGWL
ncbi:SGNH/GDSL hydrolase family protein [Ramlibacter sp. 2FC]|uniref:SGNH/GDSL hydrolase family protein n=1 Tax=Ramlibacter sp. 2FC TaxID=2502188 RepID=UPI0010F5A6F4|nr:SGNH/GDSL hydrolase family protein [Ramlibacter sp. 2FC]